MSHKIFDINLVAISKTKVTLKLNKPPAYIWMFVLELKRKMCSLLVDDNSEHKKAKWMDRNVVATVRHN